MTNNPRYNYPPGITDRDIDRAMGEDCYAKSENEIEAQIDAYFELQNTDETEPENDENS